MKKTVVLLLALLLVFTLVACGGESNTNNDTGSEEDAVVEGEPEIGGSTGGTQAIFVKDDYDNAADLTEACGISVKVPESATDVTYSVISKELAHITFVLDGSEYTLRGSKTATGEGLHGLYYDIAASEAISSNGVDGTYNLLGDGYSVVVWSANGANYALSCDGNKDAAAMSAVFTAVVG